MLLNRFKFYYMIRTLLCFLAVCLFFLVSCMDQFNDQEKFTKLEFSEDTVFFDTVFTGIGSVTKQLKIYNTSSEDILLTDIRVAKGSKSNYRVNVNGIPGNSVKNIKIRALDSMYVFVEVTVNPATGDILELDSLVFEHKNGTQDVDLVAFGRDVHFFRREVISTQTWSSDKPYLIYDYLIVDSLQILTIEAGVEVYINRGGYFVVLGSVQSNGTLENPVVFQGDRLEVDYKDIPGQWGGVWLSSGSFANTFTYTHIKNGTIGLEIDTMVSLTEPTAVLHNCKIENHSIAGISAEGTWLKVSNTLIANCGVYNVALLYGGTYAFYHCTLANNWFWSYRETPALVMNNYYTYKGVDYYNGKLNASFYNTIVYGDKANEIIADPYPVDNGMELLFSNCLIKISDQNYLYSTPIFTGSVLNKDPKFVSFDKYDYGLDTLSNAKDMAGKDIINLFPDLQTDYQGNSRVTDKAPDIGFLERIEEK